MEDEKIIAIRGRDIAEANMAFDELMKKTEQSLNARSNENPKLFMSCSPSQLERIAEQTLKEVAPSTPFHPNDIKLISGHSFPDILATDYYGVEVKSTSKNKWTSTGSSIVESTRSELVERIYLLFGCLGGSPPSFKCRPYQDCLSNIAVTHSPRYLIDMSLHENQSIFTKMNVDYESFRQLDEIEKISKVREYYTSKAKKEGKTERAWWMNQSTRPTLGFYNELSLFEKNEITVRAYILFPGLFKKNASLTYKEIALWMCSRYSLLSYNLRDLFSAGGKMIEFDGIKLNKPFPQVVGRILRYKNEIIALLKHPDDSLLEDISEYWDFEYDLTDYYTSWVAQIESVFNSNPDLCFIPISSYLETEIEI